MDGLDRKILEALRLDARKRFLDIAGELGVSDATIHKRVRKLIEEGTILGFEARLDQGKLGYTMTAFIEVSVRPGGADGAVDKLSKIDGVLEVHEIHGHCDLLVKVRTKGLSDLRDKLVKQVRSIDEVSATEAYPVMRVVKEDHSLPLLPT